MSAIEVKPELVGLDEVTNPARHKSVASTLIDVCVGLIANSSDLPGICSRCLGERDPRSSTARHPNAFCSAQCEREFVRASLVSMTSEDCVRMHARLNALLDRARKTAS